MTGGRHDDLAAARGRRMGILAFVRPAVTATGLLLLYYLMPLGERGQGPTALAVIMALVFFAVLLTWQVRQIMNAEHPRLRVLETLSVSVPLFLLTFAALYFVTASGTPASFSEALSRTDALYFTVTIFASVGFGDITPVSEGARVLVMTQMVGDLILVGIVARVIVSAVKVGMRRQQPGNQPD